MYRLALKFSLSLLRQHSTLRLSWLCFTAHIFLYFALAQTKPSSTASDEKEKAKEGNEEGKGGKKDLEDGEEKDEEEVVVKGKEMKKSKRKHSR